MIILKKSIVLLFTVLIASTNVSQLFRVLKTIETDAPVTAIDFTPDGTSLIVGTSRGKVFIYDLRSVGTPAQTITAHSGSITKLICRAKLVSTYNINNLKIFPHLYFFRITLNLAQKNLPSNLRSLPKN